ncbi:hypothetical protein E5161_18010 [Cohnella pontilimi]|uniref:GNAT-like C-terminal domain-containing protein n=1 Tax=Cohnella pontilimi TaxID=2564100 RepID=A0A4U0F774_9BACL|nr:acyltransferase domain-containing protein [Cohnella pontilimi]TJY39834.1 hypothetical protein E5161_18010 [Cohnella pontilimi]
MQTGFLSESYLQTANEILRLPPDIYGAYETAMRLMRENGKLAEWAVESRGKLFRSWETDELTDDLWPEYEALEHLLGEQTGMFYAVVLISGLPDTIDDYRTKGLPPGILTDTMEDVTVWIRDYRRRYGKWGFENFDWLKLHFTGRLFRLGRLQFVHDPFGYKIHVFRHVRTGEVAALSAASIWYDRHGLIDGNNGMSDEEGRWESSYEERERAIVGTPISSGGYARRETLCLPKEEWKKVLAENDPVLHVHIPEGGKMSHELCRKSYKLALEFYSAYFPELEFKAFACGSWLLSPQFRRLLPESSNIVRFLNDFHLFPLKSMEEWTFSRVFGKRHIDPATAPRDTALRRAILEFMAQGNRMISAGGFILREEARNLSDEGVRHGQH